MKKYLFSVLAVAIAVVAFSFTTMPDSGKRVTYHFTFIGDVTSEAQVENEQDYWQLTSTPICDGVNQKACELLDIPESFTELVGTPAVRKMKTTVDIQSTLLNSKRYVSSVAAAVTGETIKNSTAF
jgi:hypothetical protein